MSVLDLNSDLASDQARHGAISLCHDTNVPHRYLVSTDLGCVMSCSIKTESVLATYTSGYTKTYRSVMRYLSCDYFLVGFKSNILHIIF